MSFGYTPGGHLLSFTPINGPRVEQQRREADELPAEVAVASENVDTPHHLEQVTQETIQATVELLATPVRHAQPPGPPGQVPVAAEALVAATVEADSQAAITPADIRHQARSQSVDPDSSGDEDAANRTRVPGKRIRTPDKRGLMELAAVMCHTELQYQGKGKFIKKLRKRWIDKGGLPFTIDLITKWLDRELKQRDEEIANDDTSGSEIRHGSFFSHLDVLRERFKLVAEEKGKRKKKSSAQQEAKKRAREALIRAYSTRSTPVELPSDSSSSEGEEDSNVEGRSASQAADSEASTSQSSRLNTTLLSARKKQKQAQVAGYELISKSINRLARSTEDGASELARAVRGSQSQDDSPNSLDFKKFMEDGQRETVERLEAMEKLAEERQKAIDEKIDRILGLVASLAAREGRA
ncbi:hypothetical protein K469DRAFT_710229 [Zopfia rhizophila CBS 207.26]|uniref:Uncharacterized protein n=1 Tax=Zopfia rhizophila CBS 207.26 TaxID=1314779 RepID=A0A6A6DW94_9PEZI|nr:hypothetical protein K469DRAFT_710229 [Zopfia rhizophila CBS 207.26]